MALMVTYLLHEFCTYFKETYDWKLSDIDLYNPKLLINTDLKKSKATFRTYPYKEWVKVRPLQDNDFYRGFLSLSAELNPVLTPSEMSKEQFSTQFSEMQKTGDYFITVIEDTRNKEIIGSVSLILHKTFYHRYGLRGHLEDLVIKPEYRGNQLGKLLAVTATLLSDTLGCYQTTLDCSDLLVPFYESIGYKLEKNSTVISMTNRLSGEPIINVQQRNFLSKSTSTHDIDVLKPISDGFSHEA